MGRVNGTDFTGVTNVKLNGPPVVLTYSTNASLHDLRPLVTLPANAATGLFTVETPHGNATAATEFTVIPLPSLTVETSPDRVLVLSWPESGSGFALQVTDRLGPDAPWKPAVLQDAPPSVPGRIRPEEKPSNATRFYRLRRPRPSGSCSPDWPFIERSPPHDPVTNSKPPSAMERLAFESLWLERIDNLASRKIQ